MTLKTMFLNMMAAGKVSTLIETVNEQCKPFEVTEDRTVTVPGWYVSEFLKFLDTLTPEQVYGIVHGNSSIIVYYRQRDAGEGAK